MATSQRVKPLTVTAGSAITRYRFISLAADGKYDHTGTQLLAQHVSCEDAAADGDVLSAQPLDGAIMKVEAGAVTTLGGKAASDATGRAIDAVAAVDNVVLGSFLDAAGAAGEIVRVQLGPVIVDAGS